MSQPDRDLLPPDELAALQRWLQAVVTHAGGVESGLRSEEARGQLDVPADRVAGVVPPSQALTSIQRLSIYAGAYYARLLECLRQEYPVLAQTMGQELFDAFAVAYLQRYPSRSYTLGELGAKLGDYLAETRPALDSQASQQSADWPDFLVDVARLEWAIREVFDGPGVEGQALLDPRRIAALPPEEWADLRFVPVPCLRLLEFRYPVSEFYGMVKQGDSPPLPPPAARHVALTRRDYVVRRHELEPRAFHVLQELAAGRPLGQALAALAADGDTTIDALAADLQAWFRSWAEAGLFLDVHTGPMAEPAL